MQLHICQVTINFFLPAAFPGGRQMRSSLFPDGAADSETGTKHGGIQMKKILLAASEAVPYIKTGGLADVVGALPKYFDKNEYDVRVVIPKYLCIPPEKLQGFEKIAECEVSLNWRRQYAGIFEKKENRVTWYLIDNEYYFAGDQPYGFIYTDAEKFAYFSKAVLTMLPAIDFCPDVIHCSDWQTGLLPVFLKKQFNSDFYRHIKTIFTIHNMRYQGRWYMDAYKDITGLPADCFTSETLECYGQANPLKGGIVYSDFVTTVSRTYAWEIQGSAGGEGLDGLMRSRSGSLFGILNGVDEDLYNPETDPDLAENYNADSWESAKAVNKAALQRELGLEESPDAFLIGMVSRLTDQKGFDLVTARMDAMMQIPGLQFALQGTGEQRYVDSFLHFAEKYPGRVAVKIQYSEELAHRLYASADAFLMPSLFEPCGISQMISMRYGTVPLVRETGGLKDTVHSYREADGTGDGFTFCDYSADGMFGMVQYARNIYENRHDDWKAVALRGMQQDFSWSKAAAEYEKLYDMLAGISTSEIRAEELRRIEEEKLKKEHEKISAEQDRIRKEIEKNSVRGIASEEQKAAAAKKKDTRRPAAAAEKTETSKEASAKTVFQKKDAAGGAASDLQTAAGGKTDAAGKTAIVKEETSAGTGDEVSDQIDIAKGENSENTSKCAVDGGIKKEHEKKEAAENPETEKTVRTMTVEKKSAEKETSTEKEDAVSGTASAAGGTGTAKKGNSGKKKYSSTKKKNRKKSKPSSTASAGTKNAVKMSGGRAEKPTDEDSGFSVQKPDEGSIEQV